MASALENVDASTSGCATCSENARVSSPLLPEDHPHPQGGANNTIRLLTGVQFPMTFTDKGNGHRSLWTLTETFDKGVLWQQDAELRLHGALERLGQLAASTRGQARCWTSMRP